MSHLTATVRLIAATTMVATIPLVTLPAAALGAPDGGEVFVVQGLPGSMVEVTLDGELLRADVEAKAIIGPLDLGSGEHTIDFKSDDWAVSSSFEVSGSSSDIVLHWPADITAEPEVTVFANDVAPVAPDKGRLTVAHTAVVPPADVRVNDQVVFANIANGEFITSEVAADTYSVEIVPTGQEGPALLGPVDLPVEAGTLTRVFAIGEPRNGSMDAVVQTLPLSTSGSSAPDMVDAGSVGMVATPASEPAALPASGGPSSLMVWALCSVFGGTLVMTMARSKLHR
ncbi:MAG: DUF4397 domain-containing protein [Nocardioidaceae bacterium]|nr:DUF4397 domain-containing protein [Nocardioidaceae bacterium]